MHTKKRMKKDSRCEQEYAENECIEVRIRRNDGIFVRLYSWLNKCIVDTVIRIKLAQKGHHLHFRD